MKQVLDVRSLDCPKPVIETQKALKQEALTELEVLVGNKTARENVKRLLETGGYAYTLTDRADGSFAFVVSNRKVEAEASAQTSVSEQAPEASALRARGMNYVIVSDRFGTGDDELGRLLMKSLLYTLTQTEPYPESVLLLNGGVKLSTENEETIIHLKELAAKGTKIYSCGTCLNFYALAEKLQVGEIGNMYDVVERLNNAAENITIG